MKRLQKLLAILTGFVLVLSFSVSCTAEAEPAGEETVVEESEEEATEPGAEEKLTFSTSNEFPDSWGKVRIVEPSLASFIDIEFGAGKGILEEQEAFAVSGKLKGKQAIEYCINPEQGILTTLSAVVMGRNDDIK